MSTADQADKRRSKQPNRFHFVGLGKPINTMKCKKCNINLTKNNTDDNERCLKCKYPELGHIANDEILNKIGKVHIGKTPDKSKEANMSTTQSQNKSPSPVKKGGEAVQSTTDENTMTTVQGATTALLETGEFHLYRQSVPRYEGPSPESPATHAISTPPAMHTTHTSPATPTDLKRTSCTVNFQTHTMSDDLIIRRWDSKRSSKDRRMRFQSGDKTCLLYTSPSPRD